MAADRSSIQTLKKETEGFNIFINSKGQWICSDSLFTADGVKSQKQKIKEYTQSALHSILSYQKNFTSLKTERYIDLIRSSPAKEQALVYLTFGIYRYYWASRVIFYLQLSSKMEMDIRNIWIFASWKTKTRFINEAIFRIIELKHMRKSIKKKDYSYSVFKLQQRINKL